MKKRILSILLTLCMVLCLVPTSVFAEGVTSKKVETQQELVAALADDTVDVIKLGSDIAINATLNIIRPVTLDLVGYMLEMKGSGSVFIIKDGGHLTLEDSTSHRHITSPPTPTVCGSGLPAAAQRPSRATLSAAAQVQQCTTIPTAAVC